MANKRTKKSCCFCGMKFGSRFETVEHQDEEHVQFGKQRRLYRGMGHREYEEVGDAAVRNH